MSTHRNYLLVSIGPSILCFCTERCSDLDYGCNFSINMWFTDVQKQTQVADDTYVHLRHPIATSGYFLLFLR